MLIRPSQNPPQSRQHSKGGSPGRLVRSLARFARDEAGAALIEFAIVLPVLMLMFLGLVGWGVTVSIQDSMFGSAREAARDLAVGAVTPAAAEASVLADLATWGATFSVVAQDAAMTGTSDVRVSVTATNPLAASIAVVPMLPTLSAEVFMREE